jgi:N-acetylmuramic acid 6-phosphate etherase
VAFAIAGGEGALLRAVENAEDDAESGGARIVALGVGANDAVIGVAASGETPFTIGAVCQAKTVGALTIGVANKPNATLLKACEIAVLLDTGAEVIAGSTRMKAGTAQKIALNLLSTQIMVRLGRVYGALMVDMRPTNEKLRRRAQRMVMTIASCDEAAASDALASAGGDIKLAVLIAGGADAASARAALAKHEGNLRAAMSDTR